MRHLCSWALAKGFAEQMVPMGTILQRGSGNICDSRSQLLNVVQEQHTETQPNALQSIGNDLHSVCFAFHAHPRVMGNGVAVCAQCAHLVKPTRFETLQNHTPPQKVQKVSNCGYMGMKMLMKRHQRVYLCIIHCQRKKGDSET